MTNFLSLKLYLLKCIYLKIGLTTLREEILADRKSDVIWRNLIWRIMKNLNFGGNLIWRIERKNFPEVF